MDLSASQLYFWIFALLIKWMNSPIYNLIQELIRSLNPKQPTVTNKLLCYQESKISFANEDKNNPVYLPVHMF